MAMRAIFFHLALAVLIGAGCGSPGSGTAVLASVEAPPAAVASTLDSKEIVRWRKPDAEARPAGALPQEGIIVALMRWGETTLGVFDVASAKVIPLATRETGALVFSQGGNRLAALVREGPNPAKNHLELLD